MRALSLSFAAVTALAVVATPGFAAAGLLLAPLAVVAVVWWVALGAATDGRRTDAVVRVRRRELLGPGGPDDPFAGEPVERAPRPRRPGHEARRAGEG